MQGKRNLEFDEEPLMDGFEVKKQFLNFLEFTVGDDTEIDVKSQE